jgi:chromosome segregation ATPase
VHYVDKCSGKYENNPAAARYVYQMAREIIQQLDGVSAQIQWHEQQPKIFETLLNEWNRFFPASLGKHGTPRAIALKLHSQNQELESLRNQLEHLNGMKKKDINDVMKAADAQIHASRVAAVYEHKSLLQMQEKIKREYEDILEHEREEHAKAIRKLAEEHRLEELRIQQRCDDQVKNMRQETQTIEQEYQNYRNKVEEDIRSLQKQHQLEKSSLQREIDRLENSRNELQREMDQLMQYDEETVSDEDTSIAEISQDMSDVTDPVARPSRVKTSASKTRSVKFQAEAADQSSTNAVAGSVRSAVSMDKASASSNNSNSNSKRGNRFQMVSVDLVLCLPCLSSRI